MKMTFQSARTRQGPIPVTVGVAPAPKPFTWSISTWPRRETPQEPPEGAVVRDENMWDRTTEQLRYSAGTPIPADELPTLITDSELMALHRAGKRASDADAAG